MTAPVPGGVQHVMPQPLDVTWEINNLTDVAGKPLVVVVFHRQSGQDVLFLEPQAAKALAAGIEKHASQGQTGLILPAGL